MSLGTSLFFKLLYEDTSNEGIKTIRVSVSSKNISSSRPEKDFEEFGLSVIEYSLKD
jgi:hypothetical protein